MFRSILHEQLSRQWPGHLWEVSVPPRSEMGDYSVNLAFALAKSERRPVLEMAEVVAQAISGDKMLADMAGRVQVVSPGFVNVFLKDGYIGSELVRAFKGKESWGASDRGHGKTAIVEYSSPNIAKPMHVGHLRSTIIGDALANVHAMLGYKVIRWNYLGDWGTQFGKLIAAYKRWGKRDELDADPIGALEALYVRFHTELEADPSLEKQGQEEFRRLEGGDAENRKLWELFRNVSLKEFKTMYERLGVVFDIVKTESDYEKDLPPLLAELRKAGVAVPGEGDSTVVHLDEWGIATVGMLQKSDGATLYLTRDVASLRDRISEFKPARIAYVVANQQSLHFEQLFAMAELLKRKGLIGGDLPELAHVKFGLVLGADGKKFSTREGNAVALKDVLDEAERRAGEVVRRKNPDIADDARARIAHHVALAAVKYNDLRQHPHSDIVFDWDAMLDVSGNSGPYLQYTYARLASIVSKSGGAVPADPSTLTHPAERALARHLLDFGDAVQDCARHQALSGLALYLSGLAERANRFYEAVRVMEEANAATRAARVMLVDTVSMVLGRGLRLLGIEPLERV